MIEKYKHIIEQFGHHNISEVSKTKCKCECGCYFEHRAITIPSDDASIYSVSIELLFLNGTRLMNSLSSDAEFYCKNLRILI